MSVNYKRELESASTKMILVHEPKILIKMIVRMIVQKVKVSRAGVLLYHKGGDSYVWTVSHGPTGLKIPPGFARMDTDNPLIRLFYEQRYRKFISGGVLVYEKAEKILKKNREFELNEIVMQALSQMKTFESIVCVPGYFRNDLLGLLLLGKKKNGRAFAQDELDFFTALTCDMAMSFRNAQLFKELELELDRKKRLFIHTTVALAAAIDAKDRFTRGHTSRVTSLCHEIAQAFGLTHKNSFDTRFFEQLHIAGLLHDIGKIGIPGFILNKEGPLDGNEWQKMKEHPTVGAAILQPIKELKDAILGVRYHHENYDGSGYPDGLKGAQIPFIASIISVADAFDAMTSNRPYRRSLTRKKAMEEIIRVSGTQLNPEVVKVFVGLFQEGKI